MPTTRSKPFSRPLAAPCAWRPNRTPVWPVSCRPPRARCDMTDFRIRVAIIDYGMGNLHSVAKALEHVAPRAEVVITGSADEVDEADRVVFPGVGGMRDCMAGIRAGGFDLIVKKAIAEKPVLGVCVGMQALMTYSQENGGVDCL